ncbi:hypothetical protein WA026_005345 [Henosepilachna vigintioctopunctata]|uniref:Uncharacterized protein n=1 Tax=Henosepilachna vigintioctopunctata TaxID=420089 RepID=A0AAW1UMT4_9CUCU
MSEVTLDYIPEYFNLTIAKELVVIREFILGCTRKLMIIDFLNNSCLNTLLTFELSYAVWFQNKRSKERRLKQLTSMGRGPFFGGSRKMRGFPMNLSPGGLEDGPPGFPYFADGKFEFGYGGPPFHTHDSPFFPGHHPGNGGPGGMPFGPGVGPMDHGSIPMGGDFSGIPAEQNQFMQQGPPDQMVPGNGGRGGSPEFMTSGGFSDNQQQLNEGLVW